jgi:hypothetical protein
VKERVVLIRVLVLVGKENHIGGSVFLASALSENMSVENYQGGMEHHPSPYHQEIFLQI